MIRIQVTIALLANILISQFSYAAESNFYIFPVKEIEGLNKAYGAASRPFVDQRIVDLLTSGSQDSNPSYGLAKYFSSQIAATYPSSVVHAKQIGDVLKGTVKFDDDDNQQCKSSSFIAPFYASYAAVIGVSRASMYFVEKSGIVEVLVPVTLNLQIIKPDKSKIIYSTSNTLYSRFERTKSEIGTAQFNSDLINEISKNIKKQIDQLVNNAKENFNPKLTPVKVIGKDGPFIVVDKGFEVGFIEGDEPAAKDNNGKELAVKVISVDDGYSVLELQQGQQGDMTVGKEYLFLFATKADDSRKPRVMPVTTQDQSKSIKNGVIDVFTKNVGFKAPFQIAAVDVNFAQTMQAIRSRANCYQWPNQEKVSRQDFPPFILTIDYGETQPYTQSGKGGVLTKETFSTIVQGKISDLSGVVYASAIGTDKYVIERTNGIGISTPNAREISFQNSTNQMTSELLKVIKFQPSEFRIKAIDNNKQTLSVENLPINATQSINGLVLRKLSIKAGKKDVFVKLPITVSSVFEKKGNDFETSFQMTDVGKDYFKPKVGDSFVVYALPKASAKMFDLCEGVYVGKNNTVESNFANPIITNILINSPKVLIREINKDLVNEVNQLLDSGFFKKEIALSQTTESCLQPGYVIREDLFECTNGTCTAKFGTGLAIREIEKSGTNKDIVSKRVSKISGFEESQKVGIYSDNAFDEFLKMTPDLSKQFLTK